jgi:hypothetical protein
LLSYFIYRCCWQFYVSVFLSISSVCVSLHFICWCFSPFHLSVLLSISSVGVALHFICRCWSPFHLSVLLGTLSFSISHQFICLMSFTLIGCRYFQYLKDLILDKKKLNFDINIYFDIVKFLQLLLNIISWMLRPMHVNFVLYFRWFWIWLRFSKYLL